MNSRRRNKETCPPQQCPRRGRFNFSPRPSAASQQNLFPAFFHGRSQPPPPRCAPALTAPLVHGQRLPSHAQRAASVFPQRAADRERSSPHIHQADVSRRGESTRFPQRAVGFRPAMIGAVEQCPERRDVVRGQKPLIIVNACEDEMRYAYRLDLVLLVNDRLAFRIRRLRQRSASALLDEFSRFFRD